MLDVWYKALTQTYLDLTLRPTSHVTARIVERPGLWMSQPEIDALLGDLRQIARTTLPDGELDYGILTGDRDRLAKSIVTILHDRRTRAPVAFNALAVMDVDLHAKPAEVLHMGLVMVDPGVRSQGFSWVLYGLTCLVLFFRNQMRPLWLSNVTQVPAIVGMVTETFSNVFPSPKVEARRSFEHVLLARAIMSHHRHVFGVGADAGFDEQRFVITNAYTGGSDDLKKSFDSAPKHRDQAYNDFCRRELDYDRGDDVLQLCQLSLETARRFVLKDVPRQSLPAVLGALAFIALNRLVLPIAYWLTPDRAWGILRSRTANTTRGP
ncbi:MAG: hypothetical protein ACKVP7_27785 [Hyphomicrobiaceae bacterium]